MTDHDPVEAAWHIHQVLVEWTANVDHKASVALAIETAVMAGVIALAGGGSRLGNIDGFWANGFYWLGIVALVVGLVTTALVVRPRLRTRELPSERSEHYIYFGHLRSWQPSELQKALEERELLPALSKQIISMSQVAWRKHRLLQVSITAAGIGAVLLAVAAWINT